MAGLIIVDGINYDVRIRTGDLARGASILDGENAGRLKSGGMVLDTIGTFYNYTLTFLRSGNNVTAYDALYEVLTDPTNREHTIIVPYGQGTITYKAYVATIRDQLMKVRTGVQYWNNMEVSFTAMAPQRTL
jgi:hypothetical protein